MNITHTRCGDIAYEERGAGTPLLLIHANPGDHRDYDAVSPTFAASYRTIGIDLPGYGESPPPNPPRSASAMLMADALEAFVDTLDLRDAIVIGNSVGGFAAARLALASPQRVRALILVDAGGFTAHNPFTRAFCRAKGSERLTRLFAARFAAWYLKRRNEHVRQILARTDEGRRNSPRVAVDAAVWRSFLDPAHDLRGRASGISVPTLLVWGRRDPVLPVNKDGICALRAIPGARLAELDTGHEPFAEEPAAFLSTVLPFLDEVR